MVMTETIAGNAILTLIRPLNPEKKLVQNAAISIHKAK
jgi:hypothetical protein